MIPDFRRGLILTNSETVLAVKSQCNCFAILKIDQKRTGLYIEADLYEKLEGLGVAKDFIRSCFTEFNDGYYYVSKPDYNVFSAKYGPYAETDEEVLNFCTAYKEFVDKQGEITLNDAVYVEEYNILLPIVTDDNNKRLTANILLGSWLTEGLAIDGTDLEKVSLLNQWLSSDSIEAAVEATGLKVKKHKKVETKEDSKAETKATGKKGIPKIEGKFELPGREKLTKHFNEQIVDFIQNMDKYEKMGIHSIPATLLYGKPGCGKTYAVEKLADFLNLPCFEISSGSVGSPYIHETSKKISEMFEKAIDAAPSILIIDEMEAYLSSREDSSSGKHHIEEVDEFLRYIPKAIDAKVIIFGMTNMINLIDPAILRKGRFDFVEEVGMPSKQEVLAVLENGIKKMPMDGKIDLDALADKLVNRPMSDVGYIIRQAARIAVKNDSETVKQEHLIEAVNSLDPIQKEPERRRIGFH